MNEIELPFPTIIKIVLAQHGVKAVAVGVHVDGKYSHTDIIAPHDLNEVQPGASNPTVDWLIRLHGEDVLVWCNGHFAFKREEWKAMLPVVGAVVADYQERQRQGAPFEIIKDAVRPPS